MPHLTRLAFIFVISLKRHDSLVKQVVVSDFWWELGAVQRYFLSKAEKRLQFGSWESPSLVLIPPLCSFY